MCLADKHVQKRKWEVDVQFIYHVHHPPFIQVRLRSDDRRLSLDETFAAT